MNLRSKKQLVARTMNVGLDRIMLNESRLDEIKEALTRQDIKDLIKNGAIKIKDAKGRKKIKKRKTKRRGGSRKKSVGSRKRDYINLVRKLRDTIKKLKKAGTIDQKQYIDLRKKIKSSYFKSRANLMEAVRKK